MTDAQLFTLAMCIAMPIAALIYALAHLTRATYSLRTEITIAVTQIVSALNSLEGRGFPAAGIVHTAASRTRAERLEPT